VFFVLLLMSIRFNGYGLTCPSTARGARLESGPGEGGFAMYRAVFSMLFVMFLGLFRWEGPKTLQWFYSEDKSHAIANGLTFWIVIGVLAAICSGVLTWYTARKDKEDRKDGENGSNP
jgi:hypothetical protein